MPDHENAEKHNAAREFILCFTSLSQDTDWPDRLFAARRSTKLISLRQASIYEWKIRFMAE